MERVQLFSALLEAFSFCFFELPTAPSSVRFRGRQKRARRLFSFLLYLRRVGRAAAEHTRCSSRHRSPLVHTALLLSFSRSCLFLRWAELENEAKERQRALLGELEGVGGEGLRGGAGERRDTHPLREKCRAEKGKREYQRRTEKQGKTAGPQRANRPAMSTRMDDQCCERIHSDRSSEGTVLERFCSRR